ncbi:MAG: ABC transporter permease [Patescibacteria group bacterium]
MSLNMMLKNINWKLVKYFEIARLAYVNSGVYLANILGKSLTVVLRIWIFTQLYRVTFAVAGSDVVGGLTVVQVIWSLMLVQSFETSTRPMISKLIDEEIKSGSFAYQVNKPYSYIFYHLAGYFGRVTANVGSNLLIGTVAAWFLVGAIDWSWPGLFFGLLILILGYTLDFLISMSIGLVSFWWEDSNTIMWMYSKGRFLLGGVILPIALFPEKIQKIAEILPFANLYYAPARIMVNFDWNLAEKFVLVQLVWIFLSIMIVSIMYSRGVKNVAINGG